MKSRKQHSVEISAGVFKPTPKAATIEQLTAVIRNMEWSASETEQDEHWPDSTGDTYTTYQVCPVCRGRETIGQIHSELGKYGHRDGCAMGELCRG